MPAEEFGRALEGLCTRDAALARKVKEVAAELDSFISRLLDEELVAIAGTFGAREISVGDASGELNALRFRRGARPGVTAVLVRAHDDDNYTDLLERDATDAFKRCAKGTTRAESVDRDLA